MTIEATLQSIDSTLKSVLAALQSGAALTPEGAELTATAAAAAGATGRKPGRPRKEDAATTGAASGIDAKDLVEGDPEGTTYYVIQKHKTVARVLPGETPPNIEGQQQIGGKSYLEWKETYAKLSATSQTGGDKSDTAAGAPSFKEVTEALIKLTKAEGHGRPALDKIMAEYKVAKVPALEALNKNAEILAKVNALLSPPAETKTEEDDPFAA